MAEEEISPYRTYLVNGASSFATIITIGLFSSGMLTCRKIHNAKSVGAVPHIPFVAASTNCSLWLMYGIMKPDYTISFVNIVGLILQLLYIFTYHIYVENKYFIRRDFSVALLIVVTIGTYYSNFVSDKAAIINQLGIICNFFTICFFASPLSTMAEVVRSQSTESVAFPLSLMSFLTALSWTLYGFLISDTYVVLPNFVGLLLSLVQLSLFLLFSDKKKKRTFSTESQEPQD